MNYTAGLMMTMVECCRCGIAFAFGAGFEKERRRDHKSFYCPLGHSQYFPHKSDIEKLQEQLERERRRGQDAWTRAHHEAEQRQEAERSMRATNAAAAKVKKRIALGVCPCCNRSFQNLRRHMEAKHPDWAGTAYRRLTDSEVWHLEETCRWWPEETTYEEVVSLQPPGRVCNVCLGKVSDA